MPYWYVHYGITMSMYYADPDGNQMELQVDAFASSNDANRYTLGPHFEANPIGVEYEPKSDLPVSPIPGTLAH